MTLFAPLFLLGLLGIALPLWLHRMNYSNPETQPFTATFLLRHAELTAATESRLRYLLLLALRLLALILLVLLFAEPAWRTTRAALAGDDNRILYLVLDTSLSMRADNRFGEARSLAQEELDRLQPGQSVQLFSMGERLSALSGVTTDIDAVRRLVNQLQPGTGTLDYGLAMQQLDNLMRDAQAHRDLVLISDLQGSNLPSRFAQLVPGSASSLRLVPLTAASNNSRLSANWNQGLLQINLEGAPRSEPTHLEVWLNRALLQTLEVAAEARELELDLTAAQLLPGGNALELRWSLVDSLAEDNRFFLAVDRSVRLRALLLANNADLSDALFTRTALESIADAGIDLSTRIAANRAGYALENHDLVISTDLGALAPDLLADLGAYVEAGGQLLASLGPRTLAMNQVPLSGQSVRAEPLATSTGNRQSLVAASATHPLLDGLQFGNSVNLYRWVSMVPDAADRIIVRLGNGEPWALERPLGNGRLLLFTTPLDSSWSNLPLSPNFVPLLANALHWLSASYAAPEGLHTGSTLLAGRSGDPAIAVPVQQVIGPDGRPLLGLDELNGVKVVSLSEAGVYELQTATSSSFVAINTPAAESDLTPVAEDQRARWTTLANSESDSRTPGIATAGLEPQWQSFEKWLLPLIVLVMLAETIAANAHLRVRRQVVS